MEEEKIYKIIAASGLHKLDEDLARFEDIEVCGVCNIKSDIPILLDEYESDCIVVSEYRSLWSLQY